ncbi:hypothetical protein [Thermogemmatispora carboxidivorans]|uniref:hypothetical protein n=1 Tax=Thermogemmatispora carboxidivorans TaxID=1382306 RepID=UPI0012DFD27B|nr:hypothetical protein [Thermogemmatispora carboxidivorans]
MFTSISSRLLAPLGIITLDNSDRRFESPPSVVVPCLLTAVGNPPILEATTTGERR